MGAYNSLSCYWDTVNDVSAVVKWPRDKESKTDT